MDKIKTLSQAIRLGATFRPQCTTEGCGTDDQRLTSCALVAAIEAAFGLTPAEYLASGGNQLMELHARFGFSYQTWLEILRRNDDEKHTREQIADWLEAQGL